MKIRTLAAFKLQRPGKADTITEYARGFVKKCADRGVDPEKLMKIANTLELHLV